MSFVCCLLRSTNFLGGGHRKSQVLAVRSVFAERAQTRFSLQEVKPSPADLKMRTLQLWELKLPIKIFCVDSASLFRRLGMDFTETATGRAEPLSPRADCRIRGNGAFLRHSCSKRGRTIVLLLVEEGFRYRLPFVYQTPGRRRTKKPDGSSACFQAHRFW